MRNIKLYMKYTVVYKIANSKFPELCSLFHNISRVFSSAADRILLARLFLRMFPVALSVEKRLARWACQKDCSDS